MDLRSVLVVEDEDVVRYVIRETLEREGLQVQVASDGNEAMEALDKNTFDLMITDYKMPGKNGLELAAWARQRNPKLPVILMSGHIQQEDLNQPQISLLLPKPFSIFDLRDAVRKVLSEA